MARPDPSRAKAVLGMAVLVCLHAGRMELDLQDLFGPPHMESGTPATASELGRGLHLRLAWQQ